MDLLLKHWSSLVMFVGWFLQHPLRILALGGLYVALWGALRLGRVGSRANPFLLPASYCVASAGWEWLVMARTPEADLRFDLLLTWPTLLVLTVWSLWRSLDR